MHLKQLVRPHARLVATALPPVQQKLRESVRYIEHYVAAQQVGSWMSGVTATRAAEGLHGMAVHAVLRSNLP